MNRKIITNDQLNWPEINNIESDRIITLIEEALKPFSQLKRKKTPPKRIRLKVKKETEVKNLSINDTEETNNKESSLKNQLHEKEIVTKCLKKIIKIGINTITKELENCPGNVKFVVVCKSNKPLPIMTRHLQIMCINSNVPAGCIEGLSNRLSKFFNIKTVSAFAICDEIYLKNTEIDKPQSIPDEIYLSKAIDIARKLSNKVINYLPGLKNPFVSISENISEETLQIQIDVQKIEDKVPQNLTESTEKNILHSDSEPEKMETFGSDFISINTSRQKEISFCDSKNFILFQDDYSEINENEQSDKSLNYETEKCIFRYVNLEKSDKMKFNQFSIIQKAFDKTRKKEKKVSKKSQKIKLNTVVKNK